MQAPTEPPSGAKGMEDIEVNEGPFAAFSQKKMASAIQRFIVPWNIAIHGLSYSRMLTEKDIKAQLIAIIDSENLLPGYASCSELARRYSVGFGDLATRVKNAAGMY